jgi:hypothetical protein
MAIYPLRDHLLLYLLDPEAPKWVIKIEAWFSELKLQNRPARARKDEKNHDFRMYKMLSTCIPTGNEKCHFATMLTLLLPCRSQLLLG